MPLISLICSIFLLFFLTLFFFNFLFIFLKTKEWVPDLYLNNKNLLQLHGDLKEYSKTFRPSECYEFSDVLQEGPYVENFDYLMFARFGFGNIPFKFFSTDWSFEKNEIILSILRWDWELIDKNIKPLNKYFFLDINFFEKSINWFFIIFILISFYFIFKLLEFFTLNFYKIYDKKIKKDSRFKKDKTFKYFLIFKNIFKYTYNKHNSLNLKAFKITAFSSKLTILPLLVIIYISLLVGTIVQTSSFNLNILFDDRSESYLISWSKFLIPFTKLFDIFKSFTIQNYLMIKAFIAQTGIIILLLIAILGMVAFFTLLERKVLGAVQHRKGPDVAGIYGLLQPVADGVKLIVKEKVIPLSSDSFIFKLSPILVFCLSFTAWSVMSVEDHVQIVRLDFDLLYILAISSLGVYGIILGGWSSNSKYAFLGALRSAGQMLSYEIALGLSILPVVLVTGSFNLTEIIVRQQVIGWNIFGLFPAFLIFLISMLVETNRHPFDLPEAEAELVAGYNVEYGAFAFALYFLAEYASMILMSFLGTLLFLGGWSRSEFTKTFLYFNEMPRDFLKLTIFNNYQSSLNNIVNSNTDSFFFKYRLLNLYINANFLNIFSGICYIIEFMFKNILFFYFFVLVRAFLPRTRPDQLMSFGWKVLLPFSFGYLVLIIGILHGFDMMPLPPILHNN